MGFAEGLFLDKKNYINYKYYGKKLIQSTVK